MIPDYDGLQCQLTDAGRIAAGDLIERRRQQRAARLTALVADAAPLLTAAAPSAVGTKGLLLDGVAGEDKCEAARLYVLPDGQLAEARFVRLREHDRFDDERTGTFAPPPRMIDALEAVDKYNIEACEQRITAARQPAGDP